MPARSAKGTQSQTGPRSPSMLPALMLALNAGMRDAEIRHLSWSRIDLDRKFLTVGNSKAEAGEGRTISLNAALLSALVEYSKWYTAKFGSVEPGWYVFPGRVGKPEDGQKRPLDPTRPITSLKTAWRNAKQRAGVEGRWARSPPHACDGACGERRWRSTIMDIAGHVSKQMLARYSHIRMEAKRKALEAVDTQRRKVPVVRPEPAKGTESGTPQ